MARKNAHSYSMFKSDSNQSGAVDATLSQDSSFNATDVSQVDKATIHVVFDAPNSGTLSIWAKNSLDDSFFELNFGAPLTITAETECMLDLQQLDFQNIYLSWVPSAGAGTFTAVLHMASLGA